ncbi:hypothetical protein K438DRAFT_1216360 [Mycena galopus ATCC 62051]|nr:hypothetical protein K438DRAFT_1216360 [Mycena galopus ATCC 62051]
MTTVTAVSASSQSKSNMGAIIGGVLGGLVVAIVLGVLFLWTRRRRARRAKSQADTAVRPQSQFLRVEDYPARARQASNAFPVSIPTSRPKGSLAGPSTVSLLTPHEGPSAESPTAPNSDGAPSTMGDSPLWRTPPPEYHLAQGHAVDGGAFGCVGSTGGRAVPSAASAVCTRGRGRLVDTYLAVYLIFANIASTWGNSAIRVNN